MSKFDIMNEREAAFEAANAEVFEMVNKGRGEGGELPTLKVKILPANRADAIIALDRRVQQFKAAMPWIMAGTVGILAFLLGTVV